MTSANLSRPKEVPVAGISLPKYLLTALSYLPPPLT